MDNACPTGRKLIHRMKANHWKCPACETDNYAEKAGAKSVVCVACKQSFEVDATPLQAPQKRPLKMPETVLPMLFVGLGAVVGFVAFAGSSAVLAIVGLGLVALGSVFYLGSRLDCILDELRNQRLQ